MVFVETSLFSKLLGDYLTDDQYRGLQAHLIERPDAGPISKESSGVRKVRWRAGGKGKSGGVRVIYYWVRDDAQIFLITIYGKSEKEDLSSADLKRIVRLVKELKHG
jgi:mRNA-degrading endonuclease RelE of RelBE toxin-antitoxin system